MSAGEGDKWTEPVGQLVCLSGDRMVFLARRDGNNYIAFKNTNGNDRLLLISDEALDALVALATNQIQAPMQTFPYSPSASVWRQVKVTGASE